MVTRLSTAAPEVQRMLDPLDDAGCMAIARSAVLKIISAVPGLPVELAAAIRAANVSGAAVIAQNLDDRYFELDALGAPGALETFTQARAAMAVQFLLQEAPLEALYEAAIAIDNPNEFLRLVREVAGGAV